MLFCFHTKEVRSLFRKKNVDGHLASYIEIEQTNEMRGNKSYDEDDTWADADRDADMYARTVLGGAGSESPIVMDDTANDEDAHAEESQTIDAAGEAQHVLASGQDAQGQLAVDTSTQTYDEGNENEVVASAAAGPLITPLTTAAGATITADGLQHPSSLISPLPPIPDMGTTHTHAATGAAPAAAANGVGAATVSGRESGERIGDT